MRIIAGKYKGTILKDFDLDNIRPTIDRVKEGIFSKIQFEITGAHVLDLFAGTGNISLEFLSRGAERVVTCDNNKDSVKLIKQNFNKCNANSNIIEGDYKKTLKGLQGQKFDFIFLDPPFETEHGETAIELITKYKLLKESGMIIFEHNMAKRFRLSNEMQVLDEKKYGTVIVDFIGWKDESN